ncbi:hypothetical protein HK098_007234 [Nowakowskiella sp. JEL0407]|nr:hypothetical protein HK098_007234 [Nowakowskiella sp. JEL0407]
MKSRTDEASSRLGTYMLQGWVLTDRNCPVDGCLIPLLRSKDSSKWICALCDDRSNPYPPVKKVATTTPSKIEDKEMEDFEEEFEEEWKPKELTEEQKQQKQKRDLATKLLGQKLLQGWTLLGEECPICIGIPLMKNRQGEKFCVSCEKYFTDAVPESGLSLQNPSVSKEVSVEAYESPATVPSSPMILEPDVEKNIDGLATLTLQKSNEKITTLKRRKTESDPEILSIVSSQSRQTILALTNRMNSLTTLLNDPKTSVQDIPIICEAISSCAKSIDTCMLLI